MDDGMTIIKKSISEIVDTEYLEYSMYVLENRAIPSAIDGFKMVHRKLVYAMINEHGGKRTKVSDAGGISKFGYHHGEASAMGAVITLSADWNNNCSVFTGHGNFGSRLVQEAAAPRYIYISLSPEFKKIFIDEEVAPQSKDDENPEPVHYLPIIPWVLVNGISGIAVGFATDILPRSIKDLVFATKKCLKNPSKYLKDAEPIPPTFPHFRGTISQESDTGLSWATTGIIEYIGKYSYKISELPIGYDRESYINLLNKLLDTDKIRDYDDDCSEAGFGFTIKVSGAQKEQVDKDPISYFKLKKLHSENLTTLGYDGKLKLFTSIPELVHYFCEYRTKKFGDKIQYDKDKLSFEITNLTDKMKFISDVVDDEVPLRKSTKSDLLEYIHKWITTSEYGKTFVNIPLYACTTDEVEKLFKMIQVKKEELIELEKMTPEKLFSNNLTAVNI